MPVSFQFVNSKGEAVSLKNVEDACDLLDNEKDKQPAFSTYEVMTWVAIVNADVTCQQIIEREKDGDKNLVNMINHLRETIDLHCFNAWRFNSGFV